MMGTVNLFKLAAQVAAVVGLISLPASLVVTSRAATAQTFSISTEFRTALEPYGSFRHVARWGEVWVPEHISRDWRPYTVGHWIYSDDYGWYWDSDAQEAPWGWVAFHYGPMGLGQRSRLGLGAGPRVGSRLGGVAARQQISRVGAIAA